MFGCVRNDLDFIFVCVYRGYNVYICFWSGINWGIRSFVLVNFLGREEFSFNGFFII